MFNLTRGEELTALLGIALFGAAMAVVCLVRGDRGKTVEIPLNRRHEICVENRGEEGKGKININTASQKELESLPGIGPTLAARIVELRPFKTLDDLLKVRGIGPAMSDQIRERLSVE